MGTSTIVVIVVVVLLAGAALLVLPMLRRQRLRGRFGSEYDRAIEQHDSRAEAERELRERERRHAELELRPLPAGARAAYTQRWSEVQARFVDEPQRAVHDADELVADVMAARGYPATDHDERAALLSVEHSHTMDAYRAADDTRRRAATNGSGQTSTEHLREALVRYRTLFTELIGTDEDRDDLDGRDRHDRDRDGRDDRDEDVAVRDTDVSMSAPGMVVASDPRLNPSATGAPAATEAEIADRYETDETSEERAARARHGSR